MCISHVAELVRGGSATNGAEPSSLDNVHLFYNTCDEYRKQITRKSGATQNDLTIFFCNHFHGREEGKGGGVMIIYTFLLSKNMHLQFRFFR